MSLLSEIRFSLRKIKTSFVYLTDVYVNGTLSYEAYFAPYSDSRYTLKNILNEEVGIGTVNPDSIYKVNVDFNLINSSPDAHLTAFLWRSKFEITWNNEPVLLRYYGNKQQIGNSSVTLQMERKSFSMGDLILTGEDSDFQS